MAEMKIKELYKSTGMGSPFIFKSDFYYPEFAETNFLRDYIAEASTFDNYFLKEHGNKLVDFDGEELTDIKEEWEDMLEGIYTVYINSWAHIYDTLNIAYNPVYNVEEHITTQYGEHETEVEYGEHETEREFGEHETEYEYGEHETEREFGEHETEYEYGEHETETEYGNTSDTLGTHTDTATNYSVSFDGATEKETGKTSNEIGAQTNTSNAHTDTETSKLHTDTNTSKLHTDTETSKLHTDTSTSKLHTDTETSKLHSDTTTSKLHTDTVDRTGNIGIKSATALATEEIFMREKQIFFKNIFLTISREIGAYYDCNII